MNGYSKSETGCPTYEEQSEALKKTNQQLLNLLALIHRDDWQHAVQVGIEQALKDAERVLYKWRGAYDVLVPHDAAHPTQPAPAPDEIINMAREQGLPETEIEGVFRVNVDDLGRMFAAARAARVPADSVLEDAARHFFDAGWKACANFCDRDDVRFDGIVGHSGCPQFEEAFRDACKQGEDHE